MYLPPGPGLNKQPNNFLNVFPNNNDNDNNNNKPVKAKGEWFKANTVMINK
jgi:hypothetical protein